MRSTKHPASNKVLTYLTNNARSLDIALYNFHFNGAYAQTVIKELVAYQNEDGGFGNALEPDLRLPQSTALATWMAFRVMDEVNVAADNEVLKRALQYLLVTYNAEHTGWAIVRPEVDDYPHAPWWTYKAAMADFGWGNPSAELLGFLIKYGNAETAYLIAPLTHKALARFQEVEPSDFHEVFNFKALYDLANEELRAQLKTPLEQLILKAASTNPDEWKAYTAPPLKFITSPSDPFAHLFDKDLVRQNLEFLVESMIDGDHWEPNWDWSGTYPDDWKTARKEWGGRLTVKNLLTLRAFGVEHE
jgi:hypothetical protein